MEMIHYPNTLRSHLDTIVPMALFTPLYSALLLFDSHPALMRNHNNHYNHGFPNTFDYNHYVYSDYLVCSVTAIAHIIRY